MNTIEIQDVSRRFGPKQALKNVNLELPKGTVLGLIGENGAGKTTLIKHILGLLKPDHGSVRVFGLDPIQSPEKVLSRIGYLAEEDALPGWMRIDELQRYSAGFYPTWNQEYADQLCRNFNLDRKAKLKSLSKGQRARAGLMAALAIKPEFLLLDEPSSGLDPIVRRDILGAVIGSVADEGGTVLFSSHLLTEIERVADRVAMIRDGELVFCEDLDALKHAHLKVTLRFDNYKSSSPILAGASHWEGEGTEWTAVYTGDGGNLEAASALAKATVVDRRWLSLEEIFVAHSASRSAI